MEDKRSVPSCDSFYDFMVRVRAWYGPRVAFKTEGQEWTYNDLYRMVSSASSAIGDEKAVFCINAEDPVLFFVAFMSVTISGNIAWLSKEAACERYTYLSDDEVRKMIHDDGANSFEDKSEQGRASVVAQSSGTTSVSKGVMLSQRNILTDMVAGMREYGYPEGAIYYKVLPYQHLFGLVADLLGPLYSGGTICFSADRINLFKYLNMFKPTRMNLPPVIVTQIEKMLLSGSSVERVTGGRLEKIMCAGAAVSRESQLRLKEYGIDVFVAYGLTECSPCISMNSDTDHEAGSVGKILEGVNVKIEDNEILVSGNTVMLGYWNDPQATDRVFKDGWLMTGDLGYVDDDGFLFLTGRKSNLIVFEDGTKLSPEELEGRINEIPGVKECMAYSVKNNGRTTVSAKVAVETAQEAQIKERINEIARGMQLESKLRNIELTDKELQKNKLGKIVRRMK